MCGIYADSDKIKRNAPGVIASLVKFALNSKACGNVYREDAETLDQ